MTRDDALTAAVDAYDLARRTTHHKLHEPPMSEQNKEFIRPMIWAAICAYSAALEGEK